MITLSQYLTEYQRHYPKRAGLKAAIEDIVQACIRIIDLVGRGPLIGIHGAAGEVNVQGENQQKLDILSNQIILERLACSGNWASLASEELDNIYHIPEHYPKGHFLCAFDPLDGSGNIDINMPIGTIFSVLPYDKPTAPDNADFLRAGCEQVAAGYVLYGASTTMVLTLCDGVHSFTFDPSIGEFFCTQQHIKLPEKAFYAINASNYHNWYSPVRQYFDDCLQGKSGIRGQTYNTRWIGCLVGEIHRILMKGGVFILPADKRRGKENGHLRLLYECNPMALIIEQAGGKSISGDCDTLSIRPATLHQRAPLIAGTKTEVEVLSALHQQG